MMNILLTVLVLINLAILFILAGTWVVFRRKYEEFRTFITPLGENQPSPLAQSVQIVADQIGRSVVATAKATFMGKESGLVRGEQALMGDIVETKASSSPLGMLLGTYPALRKSLRRNPQLLDVALGLLSKSKIGGPLTSAGSSPSNGESPRFKL